MTTRFLRAIDWVLPHEGGYNDIKGDNGGATNYGISLVFLKSLNKDIDGDGDVDKDDIKHLTPALAKELYYDNFWKPIYEKLPELTSIKLFDTAINMGSLQAHVLLQRALNSLGCSIKVDGLLGDETIKCFSDRKDFDVLNALCNEQVKYYIGLLSKHPEWEKFRRGWMNRANVKPKI